MRIKIKLFALIMFTALLLQGCSVKARIKEADKRFAIGEYFAAGDLYRKVYPRIPLKQKPLRARIAFQQGECYKNINVNYRAEMAYLNSIRNLHSDSTVYLHYAQVLQRGGKYAEAIKNYSLYLKKDSGNLLAKNGL